MLVSLSSYVMFKKFNYYYFLFQFLGIFLDEANQSVLLVSMTNNIKPSRASAKFFLETLKSYSRKKKEENFNYYAKFH
jgi:hypothetical protein